MYYEFMFLICEGYCMVYAYVLEDNRLAKLVDYLPYKCTTIQQLTYCTSMHAHFVLCEMFGV